MAASDLLCSEQLSSIVQFVVSRKKLTLSLFGGDKLQKERANMMGERGETTYNKVLSQADDLADRVLRATKLYLPHLARFCLIATFMEDGLRMWFQWTEQKDYINITWGCGEFLGHLFVLVNMVCQLVGCGMVLVRKFVPIAVGMLFGVIVLQVGNLK